MSSSLVFIGRFPMKSFTLSGEQGHKVSDTDSIAQPESVSQKALTYTIKARNCDISLYESIYIIHKEHAPAACISLI